MSEKSVFREAWSPEMMSRSFPVSCFWSRGFVPHRKWNLTLLVHQNTGKENCYQKFFLAILIGTVHWRDLIEQIKKSVIYTLNRRNFLVFVCTENNLRKVLFETDCVMVIVWFSWPKFLWCRVDEAWDKFNSWEKVLVSRPGNTSWAKLKVSIY